MTYPEHIRAAFHEVALELMAWQDPPLVSPREYRRLEGLRNIYHPRGKQEIPEYVEPFNVDQDWRDTGN